jgi:AbiV family abortive infection protein
MITGRLDRYSGRLSAAQIAAGMNAAEDNAARLLADAVMLLNAGRYPTAASVAILCIEEAAKVSTLRQIATCRDDSERREVWNEYRSRRGKNRHSIIPSPCAKVARHLDERRQGSDAVADRSGTIDILKQLGFYTDCLGDATWSNPEAMIEQQLAEQIIGIALLSVEGGYRHTAKEIELWIAHLTPVMDKPVQWQKNALLNWHRAMAEHGLAGADTNAVENFVRGASRASA